MSQIKVNLLVQPADVEYLCQRLESSLTAPLHTDLSTYLWFSVKTLTHRQRAWASEIDRIYCNV